MGEQRNNKDTQCGPEQQRPSSLTRQSLCQIQERLRETERRLLDAKERHEVPCSKKDLADDQEGDRLPKRVS